MSRLRLTIDSDLRDVVFVSLVVNKICEHLQMDAEAIHQTELCAVEAVTNVIRHAYANEPGHEVSLLVVIDGDRLELEVCDTGTAMSSAQERKLAEGSDVFDFDPNDLASVPEGGMGLQIMHDVMDSVAYKRDSGFNSLQLIRLIRAVEDRRGSPGSPSREPVPVSGRRKTCAKGRDFDE